MTRFLPSKSALPSAAFFAGGLEDHAISEIQRNRRRAR
jgi:hypothetical protein